MSDEIREFLEFELCALNYPEQDREKLLNKILHYAMVRKVIIENDTQKLSYKMFDPIKKRLQISCDTKLIWNDYKLMRRHIKSYKEIHGEEPFCRIAIERVRILRKSRKEEE